MNEENRKAIFYQIFLRSFTDEGTLEAARKMLPSIRDLGVSIVYLCPIVEADDDTDESGWSERQHASGFKNPRNPYRMKDYFKIDAEYGTDEDLDRFVKDAHALGMRVMLDLVYLHCGPGAVFLAEHPSFVRRDETGAPITNKWHFPILNFEDEGLREYLYENMLYFVRRFDVDGYRCDVGDKVPLDFWLEGRRRLEELKPSIVMLNEGVSPAYLVEGFEWNYSFKLHGAMIHAFRDGESARAIRERLEQTAEIYPTDARCIHYIENHDTASDSYESRYEKVIGNAGMETLFMLTYTLGGAPFLYNGVEICDDARHSLWSNREFGKLHVRWENALTERGVHRRSFLKDLAEFFRAHPALYDGDRSFLETDAPDGTLAYLRTNGEERIAVLVSTAREGVHARFTLPCAPVEILRNGGTTFTYADGVLDADFATYGYLIVRI